VRGSILAKTNTHTRTHTHTQTHTHTHIHTYTHTHTHTPANNECVRLSGDICCVFDRTVCHAPVSGGDEEEAEWGGSRLRKSKKGKRKKDRGEEID
jgi:hypothetical protein